MSNTSCDNLDETQVPAKKLKQARLVFKPLTPPAKKDNASNAQKRKFNELDDDVTIIEDTNKDESKENKIVSGCLENGSVEPKEIVSKKKKISLSDGESSSTKDKKTVKDSSLKENENAVKDATLKDGKCIVEGKLNSCEGAINKEGSSKDEIVTGKTRKEKVKAGKGMLNKKASRKDTKVIEGIEEKKEKSGEELVNKEERLEDEVVVRESKTVIEGNFEADAEKKEEETRLKDDNVNEKSSESAKEPSIIDLREESNEEDKKSKDGSVTSGTSENELNVSSVSAKEPSFSSPKTPANEKKIIKPRKLTPKQLEKQREKEMLRLEREKKKAEELETKLKLKREKEELKRKEQEEKERLKREKEELKQKELEEKKRLEDLKKKEKEEKEKRRLAEIEQKNEERQRKEEEKRKVEEEKKKQDELKQQKENKVKAAFASFFVNKAKTKQPAKTENSEAVAVPTSLAFMPFQEKPCMKLAPITRVTLSSEQLAILDNAISKTSDRGMKALYLDQLKSSGYQRKTTGKTWPYEEEDDEPLIVEADDQMEVETNIVSKRKSMRAKLLQFHENHRPPYYGTWRKKSKTIKPRNPCQKDDVHFDYEVDSDDEWEEGEGESLCGSDDEKESEDDYEVDNETFVPHGYLSDEEAQEEEDAETMNPEDQKLKLKLLGEEFEAELNEKTERLKPILVGPMWINNNVEETTCVDSRIVKYLMPRRAVWKEESSPISTTDPLFGADENSPENANNPASASKSRKFTDEEIKNLIRCVHGSVRNRLFLAKEFLSMLEKSQSSMASQTSIKRKMKEIATYTLCPSNEGAKMNGRKCWFVPLEVRAQYGLSDLLASDNPHCSSIPDSSPAPVIDVASPCIMKFTKVLSEEDRLKQLTDMSIEHLKPQNATSLPAAMSASTPRITKYTKVLSEEECLKQLVSPTSDKTPKPCDKASKSPSIKTFLKTPKSDSPCVTVTSSPVSSTASQTVPKEKKRLPLLASVKVGEEIPAAVRPSCTVKSVESTVQTLTFKHSKPDQEPSKKEIKVLAEPMEIDSSTSKNPSIASGSSAKVKKRVPLLVSVKRGEQIPTSVRPSVAQSLRTSKREVKENSAVSQNPNMEDVAKTSNANTKSESTEDILCIELDNN